ncbi:hypothetical protein MLD38_037715 [Melastoma candidum]|uniref:Uncharacterized protein n=1 Tax=Melastoma candidum TaxID=119954 RepID=A0ACB9LNU7_9MYRT|nr:hypothetical protein MLD38_037715 [Melastoma candidum]
MHSASGSEASGKKGRHYRGVLVLVGGDNGAAEEGRTSPSSKCLPAHEEKRLKGQEGSLLGAWKPSPANRTDSRRRWRVARSQSPPPSEIRRFLVVKTAGGRVLSSEFRRIALFCSKTSGDPSDEGGRQDMKGGKCSSETVRGHRIILGRLYSDFPRIQINFLSEDPPFRRRRGGWSCREVWLHEQQVVVGREEEGLGLIKSLQPFSLVWASFMGLLC